MLLYLVVATLLGFVSASSINSARIPPARVRGLSVTTTMSSTTSAETSTQQTFQPEFSSIVSSSIHKSTSSSVDLHVDLKTPWIKGYLAFNALHTVSAQAVQPPTLKSTIVSYEDSQADENDLRAWTRHVVSTHREDLPKLAKSKSDTPRVLELDVNKFIKYLVDHKHFRREDLMFLLRPDLDYGYDQIEDELGKIKRNQREPQTISIGGENGGRSARCGVAPMALFMSLMAIL